MAGGVREGGSGALVHLVDLEFPGQSRRIAVEFVVEPVSPPAEGLGEDHSRGDGVQEGDQGHPGPAAANPGAHTSQGDGSPDAQATIPDGERVPRVASGQEIQFRIGNDVVEPAAEDSPGDGPEADIRDLPGAPSPGDPAPGSESNSYPDAGDDTQGVKMYGQWAQMKGTDRRGRQQRLGRGHKNPFIE